MTWNTPKPQEWKSEELSQGRIIDYKAFNFVDGEGVRNSLYVSGCMFHCEGCYNAAPWSFKAGIPYTKELEEQIKKEINRVLHTHVGNTEEVQKLLDEYESTRLVSGISLAELIRRPELSYDKLAPIDKERPELSEEVREEVNINLKYEGYIKRQQKQVEQFHKLESKKIPSDIDYEDIKSLRLEAIQKLSDIRPKSVGQAARISGVSPSDISVLTVYLEQYHRKRVD